MALSHCRSCVMQPAGPKNIFTDFAKESCNQAGTSHTSSRSRHQKHWQSDVDLHRWQQALNDSSRFDKLCFDVRQRWHPDFQADRMELAKRHNAHIRDRFALQRKKLYTTPPLATRQMRNLQMQLDPQHHRTPSKRRNDLQEVLGMRSSERDQLMAAIGSQGLGETAPTEARRSLLKGEITEGLHSMLKNFRSENSFSDDQNLEGEASNVSESERSSEDDRLRLSQDRMELLPDVASNPDRTQLLADVSRSVTDGPSVDSQCDGSFSPTRVPQTGAEKDPMCLLIFRNGDRWHSGEPMFLRRLPSALSALLAMCGQACKPVVAPPQMLLSKTLQRIRVLSEIKAGGVYLLKGMEALAPPPKFLDYSPTEVESFRRAVDSSRVLRSTAVPELPRIQQMDSCTSENGLRTRHGSSREHRRSASLPPDAKWHANAVLTTRLGMDTRHRRWDLCLPVLRSAEIGIDGIHCT